MSRMLQFSSPEQIAMQINPDGTEKVIAGVVRGNFSTAFPDGRPMPGNDEDAEADGNEIAEEEAPAMSESKEAGTIVIVADTDFLADQFSVRFMNFLGMRAMSPLNDNLAFVSNIIDFFGGSEDLISLRSRGTSLRSFDRVRELEVAAQERYQEQLEALDARLSEVQENLRNIQSQQTERGQLVASPEVREAIERFHIEEARMRAERREIRMKLREDIERLERNLALFNILIGPLLVGAFGIGFFTYRNKRQKR